MKKVIKAVLKDICIDILPLNAALILCAWLDARNEEIVQCPGDVKLYLDFTREIETDDSIYVFALGQSDDSVKDRRAQIEYMPAFRFDKETRAGRSISILAIPPQIAAPIKSVWMRDRDLWMTLPLEFERLGHDAYGREILVVFNHEPVAVFAEPMPLYHDLVLQNSDGTVEVYLALGEDIRKEIIPGMIPKLARIYSWYGKYKNQ